MLSRSLISLVTPRALPCLSTVPPLARLPLGLQCGRVFMSTEVPKAEEESKKKKVELPIDVYDNNKEWWEQITSPHDFMPKVGTAGFTLGCAMLIAMIMYNECEESEEEAENERLRQARLAAKDQRQSSSSSSTKQ
ncbi:hypothetical protein Pmar_PMAR000798 [Perkinsus marinus ATCC 50983]|uniref:Uncharacterized protein n=1 Tax=Perkinsus marinus (strain ATCC 50983 / TXsc) TaxID=423536 RepID=C5KXN0_PERM5|nr:hypothetical protein Pmar_PMAR000798 [Perkinsus marinus ATCC 50983]EER10754.1 hypothetical protein Pmar_PMAR000798 [Perkinsus marinus ATCC 50983]|eukprot:XP_002778959.1 hypothetical protein Pmar_PMAR000798 [Perkinsus marinus ATCC 50983]